MKNIANFVGQLLKPQQLLPEGDGDFGDQSHTRQLATDGK